MTQHRTPPFLAFLAILALAVVGIAQQSASEAPAGFDTPTLDQNPGSQSVSNGIPEPPGDTFALDQQRFERRNGVDDGLGPVFNATACADCHQNPVTGGPSQITEIRAGHLDANGTFVAAIPINDGANTIGGRSIVDDRAICAEAHEQLPDSENIRALRAPASLRQRPTPNDQRRGSADDRRPTTAFRVSAARFPSAIGTSPSDRRS